MLTVVCADQESLSSPSAAAGDERAALDKLRELLLCGNMHEALGTTVLPVTVPTPIDIDHYIDWIYFKKFVRQPIYDLSSYAERH